ncbi:Hypp644 [Branchiostoma lanceolatum]|uniref:Hypp644 protein n=1 Tax=Branchiostoma lanceolatum TaxID=7740 RepID=A0A8J9YLM2_BRALA|nr:Hypp644 [Branchiostoma lanceolatum]
MIMTKRNQTFQWMDSKTQEKEQLSRICLQPADFNGKESVSSGSRSVGEGMDAKLEEKNKASKAWHKGAPLAADWGQASPPETHDSRTPDGPNLDDVEGGGGVIPSRLYMMVKNRQHSGRRLTANWAPRRTP